MNNRFKMNMDALSKGTHAALKFKKGGKMTTLQGNPDPNDNNEFNAFVLMFCLLGALAIIIIALYCKKVGILP